MGSALTPPPVLEGAAAVPPCASPGRIGGSAAAGADELAARRAAEEPPGAAAPPVSPPVSSMARLRAHAAQDGVMRRRYRSRPGAKSALLAEPCPAALAVAGFWKFDEHAAFLVSASRTSSTG